jgi:hypothetical protein
LSVDVFQDERCRRVFEKLQGQWQSNQSLDLPSLLRDIPVDDANWFSALLAEEKTFDSPHENITRRLQRLEVLSFDRERRILEKEVLQMLEGRVPRDEAKITRYQSLKRTLKGVVRGDSSAATR